MLGKVNDEADSEAGARLWRTSCPWMRGLGVSPPHTKEICISVVLFVWVFLGILFAGLVF